ncbi:Uncharacterised protein [Mycobacteroides abscessus subsp. abscessus]|nr:Uncharacterised protein [Mycobacteroides abscessus subsp. abscessus]
MSGRDHLACRDLVGEPRDIRIALCQLIGDRTHPVQVHVDPERGGWRERGQAALLGVELVQRQAEAAAFDRQRCAQVAEFGEVGEVVGEEGVVAIMGDGALAEAFEGVLRDHPSGGGRLNCCLCHGDSLYGVAAVEFWL